MEHTMTPELMAAFTRRAAVMGYEVRTGTEEAPLRAEKDGQEICWFDEYGGMCYIADSPFIKERKQLNELMRGMKQAHDLYTDASPLEIDSVREFRLISQFGDVLLAAKMGRDNEVRFTTWKYDYDRAGVLWGHYHETNYEGAKRDFALRAGLIDENKIFTKEELAALHEACVFRGRNDHEISYEDGKKLQAVMEKVEQNIPGLIFDREQPEQEDSHGIQPD